MKNLITHLKNFKIRKYNKTSEDKLINNVNMRIKQAVIKKNEFLANHLWMLKSLYLAQNYYLQFIESLYKKKFYEAWLILERCEITINNLNRHINEEVAEKYYFYFLKFQVPKWQELFPYNLFISPEFIHKKVKCSICKKYITPRSSCNHIVGGLYWGEICYHIIEQLELISTAIVKNPVMKGNVIDPYGKNKNFSGLEHIFSTLPTPFHYWDIDYQKEFIPSEYIIQSNPYMMCPCDSGISYLLCCQGKKGCLIPHYHIIPYNQAIEKKLNTYLNLKLNMANYFYEIKHL